MKNVIKGIVICLFAVFLMSHNVSAAEIVNDDVSLYWTSPNLYYTCATHQGYGNYVLNGTSCHLGSRAEVSSIAFYPQIAYQLESGAYFAEVYLRIANNANTDNVVWYGADTGTNMQFVSEEEISSTANGSVGYKTYRLLYRYTGPQLLNSTNFMSIGSSGGIFAGESFKVMNVVFWKVNTSDTASVIQAINAQNQYLQDISQNLYIADGHLDAIEDYLDFIHDNLDDLQDAIEDNNQAEQDAVDNIENQSPSDISGDTDNQQSTNLIGLFSSFVNALSNITAANNCNITLAFPSFAGGSQTVNVCQNKDKGGNLVAIFSSLTLIAFYIPLALKLLSMIYNEIRSFTNG